MRRETVTGARTAGHGVGHVVPVWLLVAVWAALVVFTVLTYAATWVDLGASNLWIAIGIATVKAALVALFFMHLWWDRPINAIVLIGSLLFVALFIGLALLDTIHYQPTLIEGYSPAMAP